MGKRHPKSSSEFHLRRAPASRVLASSQPAAGDEGYARSTAKMVVASSFSEVMSANHAAPIDPAAEAIEPHHVANKATSGPCMDEGPSAHERVDCGPCRPDVAHTAGSSRELLRGSGQARPLSCSCGCALGGGLLGLSFRFGCLGAVFGLGRTARPPLRACKVEAY